MSKEGLVETEVTTEVQPDETVDVSAEETSNEEAVVEKEGGKKVTTPEEETTSDDTDEGSTKKVEKDLNWWKAQSRKHEDLKKENYQKLQQATAELAEIKADYEKVKSELDALREEADTAKTELTRLRIGSKYGLPDASLKYLTGSNEEEIEASAKELSELFGSTKTRNVVKTQGQDPGTPPVDPASRLAAMWSNKI